MISSKHLETAQLTDTNYITSDTTQTDTASAPKPVEHSEPAQPTDTNDSTSDTSQMDTVLPVTLAEIFASPFLN